MNSPDLLQILFTAIFMGALTAFLAKKRGRDPAWWFVIGLLCGIFGLIALFFYAPVTREDAATSTVAPKPPVAPIDDALSTKPWHYLDAQHNTLGPTTLADLQKLLQEQKITFATYVWCAGMQDWKKIEDLPELKSKFKV